MDTISLIEAWKIWFSDTVPPNAVLWGISILWWGRMGKLMQMLGAATIIADIIGPEKIRQMGSSLQGTIPSTMLIQFLRQCFNWYAVIFRQTILKDYVNDVDESKPEFSHVHLNVLNALTCFGLTILVVYSAQLHLVSWHILIIEFVIIFGCLFVSIAPIFTVLLIVLLILAGLVINSLFVRPLAWALENPSLDQYIKVISLLLLLAGFHFELLAS